MAAAVPSQCGSTAFKQWCHCLCNAACLWNAAALHPNTAALPVDCSNTAFRMWQHCLWTAAALLLDSDTGFQMRQHCLQLVAAQCLHMAAAVPSQCGSTAFKQWCHCLCNAACLWNAAALHPNTAALPVDCSNTACGRQQHCCWTVTLPSQ